MIFNSQHRIICSDPLKSRLLLLQPTLVKRPSKRLRLGLEYEEEAVQDKTSSTWTCGPFWCSSHTSWTREQKSIWPCSFCLWCGENIYLAPCQKWHKSVRFMPPLETAMLAGIESSVLCLLAICIEELPLFLVINVRTPQNKTSLLLGFFPPTNWLETDRSNINSPLFVESNAEDTMFK